MTHIKTYKQTQRTVINVHYPSHSEQCQFRKKEDENSVDVKVVTNPECQRKHTSTLARCHVQTVRLPKQAQLSSSRTISS